MIELSLAEYCIIIVIAALVLVTLFGWISKFAHFNALNRVRRKRRLCDLCLTVWEDDSKAKIIPCPKCGRLCERKMRG